MKTIKSGNKYYRATEIPDEITEGWVIVNASGMIIDFTFNRTREAAINKWLGLWTKPKNWKGHYRDGARCVKATRKISLQ